MMDFNSSSSISGQVSALIDAGLQKRQAEQRPRSYLGASRLTVKRVKPVTQQKTGDEMNMTILALDLGTTTGWALMHADGQITSGSQSFKPQRFEGGGMRFLKFKRWLTDVKQCTSGIDLVVFEEVRRHAGVDAAHAYGGFMGQLTAWCEHHQIPYEGVPVGTIKKHATGKGNAGKEEMIASAKARGHNPADDNEADAIALVYLTHDRQMPQEV